MFHYKEWARNIKNSRSGGRDHPQSQGMFLPKEAPELMTEKLPMELNRRKQTYKRATNPKREPYNFDYFSDFALYRGFLDCF